MNRVFSFIIFSFFLCPYLTLGLEPCYPGTTVKRTIDSAGFHRMVSYSVDVVHFGDWSDCVLCVKESIPSGLYVNPQELNALNRRGQLTTVVSRMVDVEAPQSLAKPHEMLVYSPLEADANLLTTQFSFPIHVRYHSPKPGGGYERARLPNPTVHIHCSEQPKCQGYKYFPCYEDGNKTCRFYELKYKTNAKELEMAIPVGNSDDFAFVAIVTGLVTSLACCYLIFGVVKNSPEK